MKPQVEELAKLLCADCANSPCKHKGRCEGIIREATLLLKAGYRKGRTGTWIQASSKPGTYIGMKCSLCGARIKYSEYLNGNHRFCYKCGAKMIKED